MESSSSSTLTLTPITSLSIPVLSFFNNTFNSTQQLDLSELTRLTSELDLQCSQSTHLLSNLTQRLQSNLLSYSSVSDQIDVGFKQINSQLQDLKSNSSSFGCISDGRGEQMVAEELPALAKEVARVEMVRNYAETALKLDSLVGDIEDAVSSLMNKNFKKQSATQSTEELHVSAIKSLKLTEEILASITKSHPQWVRLVSATDHRVDRALAVLRPQAVADHRTLLNSVGWPPPLSTLSSSNLDTGRSSKAPNPLATLHGELKRKYCETFIALCSLQELQRRRKSRQLEGYNHDIAFHQPLWAIEELANPLSLASHQHFQKWVDKPEFIFALVYKITRDYIDSVDELLQPLVDEAMLTGYSCREEWISAMVISLSTYLAKEIFPTYVSRISEESTTDVGMQTRNSWLHLIDLMISFDKRIQVLASHSGIPVSVEESGLLQRISSLSVFCDRPDWLDIWAEIELGSILDKLKSEMEDDRNWTSTQGAVLFPGSEDYKSPTVSSLFLRHISSISDRCRSLPTVSLRSKFIRSVGLPIVETFFNCLLTKCLEAEGLTALADDDALGKVMTSINAAHHIESVLKEWCEDVFFLEMGLDDDELDKPVNKNSVFTSVTEGVGNGVFDEGIRKIEEFRKEWVNKITNVVLRGFDAQSRDYVRNRKQWQERVEDGWTVTKSFVMALDYLQGRMAMLEGVLNGMDFAAVWRSLASGIDHLMFNGILLSNAKFNEGGVGRLGGDVDVLFGVFRTWCLRPEGFFPRISEGLKLLKMEQKQLQDLSKQGEEWLKYNGIRYLNITEAQKIARCRVFS